MYFPMMFDPTYILLIPALILALYAQQKVHSTFARFSRVPARAGRTGAQVARELLHHAGLRDVPVEMTHGTLSDHYDPRARVMRLSPEVYNGTSIAALAVAAHETGHAIQHAGNYIPLAVRNGLFPVAAIGSQAAFPLFLIGLLMGFEPLLTLGIWLFIAALAFQVVTLPVEFDASGRAMRLLAAGGYLDTDEVPKAKAVLDAAALTYVAAVAVSLMHLLRLLILRNARD
ncbi:MAG TPA: zinc metallopeptidase [Limnochordales bacterium]|nr:zinc metallopeptidase [Limnochordales bacterium]